MRAALALRAPGLRPIRPAPPAAGPLHRPPPPRPTRRHPAPPALAATAGDVQATASSTGEEEEEEDNPAGELTAEELAMALDESAPGPTPTMSAAAEEEVEEEEEEEDDDDDDDEDADAAVAAYDDDDEGEGEDDDGSAWATGGQTPADLADAADPADAAARALALALAAAAGSVKAGDVTVLHVAPLVYWTSYLVLVTVFSRPQLGAVLAKAEAAGAAQPHGRDLGGQANPGRSAWECLDFGDVVLHVLTPAQREFYDIDGFYGAAAEVPVPGEEQGGGGGAGGAPAAGAPVGGETWARQMK